MAEERVQLVLSREGYGSRREIESWIRHGYIQINGKPARLGQKIDRSRDSIRIRGRDVDAGTARTPRFIIALYKPRGVVSTARDPEGRQTVVDLVPKNLRLFPVGRLDLMSEGLILMTNDGDLAQRISHPSFEVPKVYEVKIRGNLDQNKIDYLSKGVATSDGKFKGAEILKVKDVTQEGVKKFQVTLRVHEGKNHLVRKMFDAVRCRVIRLKRTMIGSVELKGIPRGGFRILPRGEVTALRKSVGL